VTSSSQVGGKGQWNTPVGSVGQWGNSFGKGSVGGGWYAGAPQAQGMNMMGFGGQWTAPKAKEDDADFVFT